MIFRHLAACVVLVLAALAVPAILVPRAVADERAMILPVHPEPLVISTGEGARRFTIEIADTGERRSRGLMFRREMAADHGMLFVFERTGRLGFWMKNTPLPLDLLFIAESGEIRAILPGEPFSTASIDPGEPARFVLELNAGTAEANGIRPGDLASHPAIAAASGG